MKAAALLLLLACTPEIPPPDATIHGVDVVWGAREYADAEDYFAACEDALGPLTGRVEFHDESIDAACNHATKNKLAGCAMPWWGLAYVRDRDTIWQTAACHEVAHLVLDDVGHTHPAFAAADALERR